MGVFGERTFAFVLADYILLSKLLVNAGKSAGQVLDLELVNT